MNMTQEMLEILIGKYLDGEIASHEQQMLEAAMESNPQTRELLEQLLDLHQRSREVVCSEVLERGKTPDEIFEQAWLHRKKNPSHRVLKFSGRLRFVTGLAAGLVVGLTLHLALSARLTPTGSHTPEKISVQNIEDVANIEDRSLQAEPSNRTLKIFRNIDWYSFTDEDGDQWIVEGLRENVVRPAAYNADL